MFKIEITISGSRDFRHSEFPPVSQKYWMYKKMNCSNETEHNELRFGDFKLYFPGVVTRMFLNEFLICRL